MKKLVLAAVAAVTIAGAAHSATVTTHNGAPYPGLPDGQTMFMDFDHDTPAGVSLTGNYTIYSTPSGTGESAPPAGSPLGNGYLSVPNPQASGSATLNFTNYLDTNSLKVDALSFYWGSVDTYNWVDLLDRNGNVFQTIQGGDFLPASGNQTAPNTNLRFNFAMGANDDLGGLRFHSNGFAFEIDNVAMSVSAVPEPHTWLTMIAGFGMVGFILRRNRRSAVTAIA